MQVQAALAHRSDLVTMAAKEGSLDSVRSGVRSFMGFAIYFLGYLADAVLPPRADEHVLQWLFVFRCLATGINYLAYLLC